MTHECRDELPSICIEPRLSIELVLNLLSFFIFHIATLCEELSLSLPVFGDKRIDYLASGRFILLASFNSSIPAAETLVS